jgi:hypothetical protein
MRTFLIASTAAVGLLVTTATAQTGGRPLTATLTGAAEVPVLGDPDGTGTARITVNPGLGRICYTLQVSRIAPATAAHIHEAPEGEAGDVVQGLMAPASGRSSGCVTNRNLARELLRNPEDYYVNVHNAEFPGGALRGQLGK